MQGKARHDLSPLLSPYRVRGLELPNRFVMAPMTRSFAADGVPIAAMVDYYRRRVEGGAGLIITEGIGIPHPAAIGFSGVDVLRIPFLFGDAALDGWKKIVEAVHGAGGRIIPQLWHQGGMRTPGTGQWPDAESVSPSGLWGPLGRKSTVPDAYIAGVARPTRPMTESEIADVVAAYAKAAANAVEIGFDGIAIHGAHGYLIDQFLWDETNRRQDRWGGSPARRGAFAAAVISAIRAEIGEELPIFFRWSQWKQQDFDARLAATPDELAQVLAPMVEAGADVFDVSERNFDVPAFEGSELSLAGWTRKVTGRGVMTVGSIGLSRGMHESHALDGADVNDNLGNLLQRFESGEFDLAGVGRMMITHPDWVERVSKGREISRYDRSLLAELK